jgi:RNA polymerase sigma factor (TIGR02999 family)
VAARLMRRVLVDHARARQAAKRGGGETKIPLDDVMVGTPDPNVDLLALDAALNELAALDPRQARIVDLRYFGGLSIEETAAALEISPATVKREWQVARAWLRRALGPA